MALNQFMQSKLEEVAKNGIMALEKERDKTGLYVQRMELQPSVYQNIKYYKDYLDAINEELKKLK